MVGEELIMKTNNYVYFIKHPETGNIKIGRSSHPYQRIKELRTKNKSKLEMLLVIPFLDMEYFMHDMFSDFRLDGEWFKPDDKLKEFIIEKRLQGYGEYNHDAVELGKVMGVRLSKRLNLYKAIADMIVYYVGKIDIRLTYIIETIKEIL